MLQTYKAIIRGNQIQWLGDAPASQSSLEVDVTVRGKSKPDSGRAMAEALEDLAKIDAFKDILDPVEWQRQMRHDKPLLPDEK